jgi:hypothetical protein
MKLKNIFVYDKNKLNKLALRIAIEELAIYTEYKDVLSARRSIMRKAKKYINKNK